MSRIIFWCHWKKWEHRWSIIDTPSGTNNELLSGLNTTRVRELERFFIFWCSTRHVTQVPSQNRKEFHVVQFLRASKKSITKRSASSMKRNLHLANITKKPPCKFAVTVHRSMTFISSFWFCYIFQISQIFLSLQFNFKSQQGWKELFPVLVWRRIDAWHVFRF